MKKRMINLKWLSIAFTALFFTIVSCDDDVTVENTNALSTETFFESLSQVESSANAAYAQLQNQGLYKRFGYILPDGFSDENEPSADPNFLPAYEFNITPSLNHTAQYWNNCFNGIGTCNFVLSGEQVMRVNEPQADFSEADIDNVLGQAYFLRALYYYHLVKRYGGVPLLLEVQEVITPLPRSTEEEVYQSIIDDLNLASNLLPAKGLTENGRATKGAALGLLGKVYLHREMYNLAQSTFAEITDYSLLPLEDYENNFNESGEYNDESMFEVDFSGEFIEDDRWADNGLGIQQVTFHSQEYTGWGNFKPSQKLQDEFETGDPRKKVALIDGTTDLVGPARDQNPGFGDVRWFKFSQLYDDVAVGENSLVNARILRYADVILMQAEVENKLGNDSEANGALFYLNQIRARAEMPLYGSAEADAAGFPVNNPQEVFNAIVHERMVELCGEGVRFDDLVRWNLDAANITTRDDGVTPRGYNPDFHKLMPIPQIEIDTNPNISSSDQNPGY